MITISVQTLVLCIIVIMLVEAIALAVLFTGRN